MNERSKKSADIPLLNLWKFTLYDSLEYETLADSICTLLVADASKLKHPKSYKIYLFAGNTLIDENEYEKGIITKSWGGI